MRVMGIDGCRAGWVATIRPLAGGDAERIVAHHLDALLGLPDLASIAIDMPIGLPEKIGPEGRGPEKALRPRLGARQSSVFSVPSRAAVYAEDYGQANRLSLMTSEPPRKISKQCFFLFPKMREIDGLLRAKAAWAERVHECHPEGAFMAMNGGQPLTHPKKVKGQVYRPGMEERVKLLTERAAFAPDFLHSIPKGVGWDDCLDSAACAWSAARIARGEAMAFPENSVCDGYGLRMVIRV
jgi:predicted RNase H-like nuclease